MRTLNLSLQTRRGAPIPKDRLDRSDRKDFVAVLQRAHSYVYFMNEMLQKENIRALESLGTAVSEKMSFVPCPVS